MSLDLFVKTWRNDWQWLRQAILSVEKTCKEQVKWGIVVDDGTKNEFMPVIHQVQQELKKDISAHVAEASNLWPEARLIHDGYLRQQWIKMNSHVMMGDGQFWIWDSDLIAHKPFSNEDFRGFGGKQIYWFTPFNSIMGGTDDNAHRLRIDTLKEIYGIPDAPFEWMRCIPIPQIGNILKHGSQSPFWKKSFDMLVAGHNGFSEFNVIGQFCHLHFIDAFDWRNTHNYPGKTFSGQLGDKNFIVSQGHSWSGIPSGLIDFVRSL